jgi:hypothetical protein
MRAAAGASSIADDNCRFLLFVFTRDAERQDGLLKGQAKSDAEYAEGREVTQRENADSLRE